ncbi:MAG: class I SAM-dependent methyltransferase [Myxococcota bacterium]|nr:class I SAM-dependent methyltransferase [Myxococcota bacterium]
MYASTAQPSFVASTKKLNLSTSELTNWAAWLAVAPYFDRPLPPGKSGFVVDREGLRLVAHGFKDQHWHPGMAHRRIKIGHDALTRVMGLTENMTVLDCTLGMGHDALVMANAGARIIALEREPGLLIYTMLGIHEWSASTGTSIAAQCCDFRTWLRDAAPSCIDHVYLDPMFPPSKIERRSTTWAILRRILVPNARLSVDELDDALRVCRKSVVLKLGPGELPQVFQSRPPDRIDGSKRVRFAQWFK